MIEFILLYLVLCASSVGTGRLYVWLIREGNLFEFMQPVISYFKDKNTFLYKSLGGCEICNRQRFTDLSYILLLLISPSITNGVHWSVSFLVYFALYIFYGGLAFFLESFIIIQSMRNIDAPTVKTQNIEI